MDSTINEVEKIFNSIIGHEKYNIDIELEDSKDKKIYTSRMRIR